jgi:hypothetical protein
VCQGHAFGPQNDQVNGNLWIQALTYFRDKQGCDDQLMTALRTIREKNILPPLLVLEILKDQHRLKYKVLKEFLVENLKSQTKQINRSKEKLAKDMADIKTYKNEIVKMKCTAVYFD